VAEVLAGVTGGAFVVVNAMEYADLEVVVLGLLLAWTGLGRLTSRRNDSPPSKWRSSDYGL
jgi:hypothetical protein